MVVYYGGYLFIYFSLVLVFLFVARHNGGLLWWLSIYLFYVIV